MYGKIEESYDSMTAVMRRAETLNHAPTLQFMKLHQSIHRYNVGRELSIIEAQKLVDELQIPTLKATAKAYLGLCLIGLSKSKEDQMGGLEIALSAADEIITSWGADNG